MDKSVYLQTDIYAITCEALSAGRNNIEVVRQLLAADVKIIQYREKEKTKREKYEQCFQISKMCKKAKALFIVNDDVDLALAVEADGVHVGQDDLPVEVVRKLVGKKMLIGVSVSSPAEAEAAAASDADYLGVGPVFGTNTKTDAGEPVGLDYLALVAARSDRPIVAIGGINENNILAVRSCGVSCVAMISALVSKKDIAGYVAALREKISKQQRVL
ncbi:MAG: thiamine phosphate synthase [Firmicutes bacterium]|nr:thiamine phosphate synthase [Bacillota bacterium]